MLKYKRLSVGIVFFVVLVACSYAWHSYQTKQQQSSSDRFLSAAIEESQNCLRKLSGWRDHLMHTDTAITPQLKNCRLNTATVEIKNLPKPACLGLAKKLFRTTSKISALQTITIDNTLLTESLCTNTNTIQFNFETTEAGLEWYQKIVQASRRRDAILETIGEQNAQQVPKPDLNVGTVVARLKRIDNDFLYDFTVSLENGNVLIITQEDDLSLNNGDAVMVIHENGQNRIRNKISP